jgi:hypothetical protein
MVAAEGLPDGLSIGRQCEVFQMKKFFSSNEQILPRPPEKLPNYADARARRNLAEKLVTAFGLSEAAAESFANAVVDPSAVRRSIGDLAEGPNAERIPVPGGKVLGLRTEVWSRRIMPNPGNPRTLPNRKHPFAVDPGSAGEDSRFRPMPEPHSPEEMPDTSPELVVEIDNREHLEWASDHAATYVLGENDWRKSIKAQGVMEAVWLAACTFVHADGTASVTVPISVEGSSRTTAVHDNLSFRSSNVPYEDLDRECRAHYKKLNDAFERRTETPEDAMMLRCERMPALLLVGFEKNSMATAGFPTAVKSLVALRHVDHPKAWGDGPEHEALADEVLDELKRRNLISPTERAYYAGSITKTQARGANLPDDPAVRATKIIGLLALADDPRGEAIRIAVTSQSTRRRITRKTCNELAVALIVRSVPLPSGKVDQVRRYLWNAFGDAVYKQEWEATNRDTETLKNGALKEVLKIITNENITEPGPTSLELMVRAAYPLVVTGSLTDDRGSKNNDQPDRRILWEVLDRMRFSKQGIHQFARALKDFAASEPIRAVDENGEVKQRPNGLGDLIVNDVYLREQFPPLGKVSARTGGVTPGEQLKNRLADLSDAMDNLEEAFKAVIAVTGLDGGPLVAELGVEPQFATERRKLLSIVGDELNIWGRTFRQRHGVVTTPKLSKDADENEDEDDADDAETVERDDSEE